MNENMQYTLVTGASSGIGRQIAITLSDIDNIIICARNIEKLEETKNLCAKKKNILIFPLDVSKINDLENQITDFIEKNKISITKYVHSAGINGMKPLRTLDYEFVKNVFDVNVFSFIFIVKLLKNKKINNGHLKNVVMISSNIAEMGAKAFVAYSSSKAAANGVVRSLALELAPEVRVNSISPGAIKTEMTDNMGIDNQVIERMKLTYPLGWGKTKNIADAVKFLLSDESEWITGENIVVDGGRTINLNG